MQRKTAVSLFLSLAVSVILIGILLSRVEVNDFIGTFTRIHYPALLLFMLIALVASSLRAWRYKWLLYPLPVGWRDIFLVTFIRNLFVDLLPARIGSLSYIYVLNKSLKYRFENAASSFVVAFVFDFITLPPFLAFALISVGIGSSQFSGISLLLASFLFLIIVILIFWKLVELISFFLRIFNFLTASLRWGEKGWVKVVQEKSKLTQRELIRIKQDRNHWFLFFLSLGIRLAKYFSLYVLLFALLRSQGFHWDDLSFAKTILGITGAEMTSILPIKGIGGFGTWESAWALTLTLLGFESRIAILSSGVHLITNLFEYLLGISSILTLTYLSFRRTKTTLTT